MLLWLLWFYYDFLFTERWACAGSIARLWTCAHACPASVFTNVHLRRGGNHSHGKYLCNFHSVSLTAVCLWGGCAEEAPFHSSSGPILPCSAKIKRLPVHWAVVISAIPQSQLVFPVSSWHAYMCYILIIFNWSLNSGNNKVSFHGLIINHFSLHHQNYFIVFHVLH